jgi:hypothetical protein
MLTKLDRKKAERYLKKMDRRLKEADSEEERSRLQMLRDRAQVDLNYTIFYPLACVYKSLYPKDVRDEEENDVEKLVGREKGDKKWWDMVEKGAKEGSLRFLREALYTKQEELLDLEAKRQPATKENKKESHKPKESEKKNSKEKKAREEPEGQKDDGDDSDSDGSGGGFFETAS